MKPSVILLCSASSNSWAICHAIEADCRLDLVIVEDPPSQRKMALRRLRSLGFMAVFGQVLFILFNRCRLLLRSKQRASLFNRLELTVAPPFESSICRVTSVNNPEVTELLKQRNPDLVLVNGTRIISKRVFDAIDAPFINTHVGITPRYRGVHGGYWALASDDAENFGVTVHLIDSGIDTGQILYQKKITPDPNGNINTYPIEQVAAAIPLIRQVIEDFCHGKLRPFTMDGPSKLWYHPTIWGYLWNWAVKGVR